MPVERASVRLPEEKTRIYVPGPVRARFVKLATPEALVFTLRAPLSAPGPEKMAALTINPAAETRLPLASRSWITGCCENGTPEAAVAEGCTVMLS